MPALFFEYKPLSWDKSPSHNNYQQIYTISGHGKSIYSGWIECVSDVWVIQEITIIEHLQQWSQAQILHSSNHFYGQNAWKTEKEFTQEYWKRTRNRWYLNTPTMQSASKHVCIQDFSNYTCEKPIGVIHLKSNPACACYGMKIKLHIWLISMSIRGYTLVSSYK